jgi:hypothetical protein
MVIDSTEQKLRNLGYRIERYLNQLYITMFENTLLVHFRIAPKKVIVYILSNGKSISYPKWIHDHYNILNGNMFIQTFDELLVAIDRTTLMGG